MEIKAFLHRPLSRRVEFWVVFLILVLVCLGFLMPEYLRRRDAARTCNVLSPLIQGDARFKDVMLYRSTSGHAIIGGSVNSSKDAEALRELIERAHVPQHPFFGVRVLTRQ